jgi:hypothetical protein
MSDDSDINEYNVVTVEKTTPPEDMQGDNWHRYVIGKGSSRIEGKKPGSLHDVTQHAETVVEDLNSRKAKGGSMYAPRKRV